MALNIYAIATPIPADDAGIWSRVVGERATQRRSLDGTMVLLKWPVGETPNEVDLARVGGVTYTHAEILAVMATPAWEPA